MPKTLTLSEPELSMLASARTVKWDLLDQDGVGYRISWIERAFDTLKPECMAFACKCDEPFACKCDERGLRWTNYHEQAVSYNPDAALALNEVLMQLKEKYGYEYVIDLEPTQLMRGEVVADGNR